MLQRKFFVLFPILTFFVVTNGQLWVPAVEVQGLVTGLRVAVPDDTLQDVTRRNSTTYDVSSQNVGYDTQISDPFASLRQLSRFKRQNSMNCKIGSKFLCDDGQCISIDGKCDGKIDCNDGSDEYFSKCRKMECPRFAFQCAYGACINENFACDGEVHCKDESDEKNKNCSTTLRSNNCGSGKFQCDNKQCISSSNQCNGKADCSDSSDETLNFCYGFPCNDYLFKCAYGACIDQDKMCDGTIDCIDGSDEDEHLCNHTTSIIPNPVTTIRTTTSTAAATLKCPYPTDVEDGKIALVQIKRGAETIDSIELTCDLNSFDLVGSNHSTCLNDGNWSPALGVCKKKCRALQRVDVSVTCKYLNANINCTNKIPSGSTAQATCQMGYKVIDPVDLKCIDGNWDYNLPECTIDCGRTSGFGKTFILGGEKAAVNGFPWHVGIYELSEEGYEQICGGTILTEKIVISAAHCFWFTPKTPQQKPGLKSPQLYSVAAGKNYRSYENSEFTEQIVLIEKILISNTYNGNTFLHVGDIALLILENPLKFSREVLPICFNMQRDFVKHQLQDGGYGMVAGWGVTSVGGNPSEELQYANLTLISKVNCIEDMPETFQRYITYDKFCAGYLNANRSVCTGDSGGGLVFPSKEGHIIRYYIQGIVSVGVPDKSGTTCASGYYTTFTKIKTYKRWINAHLGLPIDSDSKDNCEDFSETQVRDIKQCKGRLLFEDNFTGTNLDKSKWVIESRFPNDEQEDEFVTFLPSAVSLKDNNLQIQPTLLSNRPGFTEESIFDDTLDIQPCTAFQPSLCNRTAEGAYILPPIVSGKIRSQFSFKYGKIEIKAKLPQGDWIYPVLYLEPANSEYGLVGFESGIMRIAFARGNSVLQYGNKDISNKALSGGVILGHEESCRIKGIQENSDYTKNWGDSFHTYGLIWSPSSISLEVDGKPYGSINPPSAGFKEFNCNGMNRRLAEGSPLAPFDKEFYVSIGVGVGGVSNFPNNIGNKPWKNKAIKAILNFWQKKDTWYHTWGEKSALLVDSVKVWAL